MMMRLREELIIATVLLTGTLTAASLLMLRKTAQVEIRKQVVANADASKELLRTVHREREERLSRTAALLSELPTLKALMATQHRLTVQDGSKPFWKLSGGDIFLLASPDGKLLAKHFATHEWPDDPTEALLRHLLTNEAASSWWSYDGRLYWVFLHPLRAGAHEEMRDLGVVVLGYETGPRLAEELAKVSASEIAFSAGGQIVASTLDASTSVPLQNNLMKPAPSESKRLLLGGKEYSDGIVTLQNADPTVLCHILFPLEASNAFLSRVNRMLLVLGIAALGIGGVLFCFIARAMTRPLENVVAGIRALVGGDYSYNVSAHGSLEIEHLACSFASMRTALLESQQNRLAADRAAMLDRTASSISHDLRHYLSALVANAEFLRESDLLQADRDEIYSEIEIATDQMLDMIDSLRDLSREQRALAPVPANLGLRIQRAIDAVVARQDCRELQVTFEAVGDLRGKFDPSKIERVFVNLILNACQAVACREGRVTIECRSDDEEFTVRVIDNGPGIAESIRDTLFDPFVSSGKSNGTGLGLAIVQKFVHDHRGSIIVENTSACGTTMLMRMPRCLNIPSLQQSTLA